MEFNSLYNDLQEILDKDLPIEDIKKLEGDLKDRLIKLSQLDNNKAERGLRHLVLKRKISFGARTQKGADRLSVLMSALLSLWNRNYDMFFQEYADLK